MNKFLEITALQKELKSKLTSFGKEAFSEALQGFFEKYPDVDAVYWEQATPYFNDGDTCYFRVHDKAVISDKLYDEAKNSDLDEIYKWEVESDEHRKIFKDLDEIMEPIDESIYEAVFGDHVSVTIRRDGEITTDEYEHD